MKKTEKIKYELDPLNRLIVSAAGKRSGLPKYRKVLNGRIKTDDNNSFIYQVKSPQSSDIPSQIRLTGKWSLAGGDSLVFTLTGSSTQYAGNRLTVKGELIDGKHNRLSFSVRTRNAPEKTLIYILKLTGKWQADRYNRLAFAVEKEYGRRDVLTMTGKWEIGRNNKIIYTYEKARLIRKEKESHTVTLKGYWDIPGRNRIIYVLDKGTRSHLSFRVSIGKPVKRGLVYEIGVGNVPSRKRITLFGKWKINKRAEIVLEMPYEKEKLRRIVFGARYKFGDKYGLTFTLKNAVGKDLGLDVKFSKKILKEHGEIFLKSGISKREKYILAGAGWRC